jgi:hypothetical protein
MTIRANIFAEPSERLLSALRIHPLFQKNMFHLKGNAQFPTPAGGIFVLPGLETSIITRDSILEGGNPLETKQNLIAAKRELSCSPTYLLQEYRVSLQPNPTVEMLVLLKRAAVEAQGLVAFMSTHERGDILYDQTVWVFDERPLDNRPFGHSFAEFRECTYLFYDEQNLLHLAEGVPLQSVAQEYPITHMMHHFGISSRVQQFPPDLENNYNWNQWMIG